MLNDKGSPPPHETPWMMCFAEREPLPRWRKTERTVFWLICALTIFGYLAMSAGCSTVVSEPQARQKLPDPPPLLLEKPVRPKPLPPPKSISPTS